MQLPETKPRDDPGTLWALQVELMSVAQSILGPRDPSKQVYQPQFTGRRSTYTQHSRPGWGLRRIESNR